MNKSGRGARVERERRERSFFFPRRSGMTSASPTSPPSRSNATLHPRHLLSHDFEDAANMSGYIDSRQVISIDSDDDDLEVTRYTAPAPTYGMDLCPKCARHAAYSVDRQGFSPPQT